MIKGMLRVIVGFVVACLAAGLTIVLFVYTPLELATEFAGERVSEATLLALAAATHSAVFAAPFALIGAGFGEWRRIGSWLYYTLVGIAIAAVGFLAQFWTEAEGEASIVNSYAMTAFIVTGFVAGLVYWLFSGRNASGYEEPRASYQEVISPPRSESPAGRAEGPSARVATWRTAN
jgi:drug/metabolite transporter (DMT)-like permease